MAVETFIFNDNTFEVDKQTGVVKVTSPNLSGVHFEFWVRRYGVTVLKGAQTGVFDSIQTKCEYFIQNIKASESFQRLRQSNEESYAFVANTTDIAPQVLNNIQLAILINNILENLYTPDNKPVQIPADQPNLLDRSIFCFHPLSTSEKWAFFHPIEATTKDAEGNDTIQPESSEGANDGAVVLRVANPNGSDVYNYSIDNGITYQANGNFSGLAAGVYAGKIKNLTESTAIGAEVEAELTINIPLA